jgi:hypothetical protein
MFLILIQIDALAMVLENPSEVIIPYQAVPITASGLQG